MKVKVTIECEPHQAQWVAILGSLIASPDRDMSQDFASDIYVAIEIALTNWMRDAGSDPELNGRALERYKQLYDMWMMWSG